MSFGRLGVHMMKAMLKARLNSSLEFPAGVETIQSHFGSSSLVNLPKIRPIVNPRQP